MADKKVTTKNDKDYKIHEYNGKYTIYKIERGFFNTEYKMGETRNFEDALSLIKVDSGSDIKEIK